MISALEDTGVLHRLAYGIEKHILLSFLSMLLYMDLRWLYLTEYVYQQRSIRKHLNVFV